MACRAATLFTLLLNYLASSKGALSPPLNLSVELLDFKALARWLPGSGNPEGTTYSLEFIDIEHFLSSPWNQTEDCTNITSTQCYLIFNQRILTEYFVRVGAKWEDEQSEWMCLPRSFQPYKYTLLSAPDFSVSAEQNSISISLSHPVQSMMGVHIRFSVDLFQITDSNTEEHIAQNITTKSSGFVNLPPGNYCINASAFLTAEGHRSNQNSTICVFLHLDPNEGYVWVFIVALLPLLSIPAVVGLILIYCYVKPSKNSCIPKTMQEIIEGTGMARILNPEDPRALPLSRIFTEECKSVHQESVEDSSQVCYGGSDGQFQEFLPAPIMDEANQDSLPSPYSYSKAARLEDGYESQTETESCSNGLTLDTLEDAILPSDQNEDSLKSYLLFMFGENFSLLDFKQTESESETESLHSDAVFGDYEPRPDPLWMHNLHNNAKL